MADFDRFVARVRERLEQGREAYADRSFSRDPGELIDELEQEALDLAGWGFVLWVRLQRARAAAAALDTETDLTPPGQTDGEIRDQIESLAREHLHVSGAEAIEMLHAGKLAGTVVQVEIESRLFLLGEAP